MYLGATGPTNQWNPDGPQTPCCAQCGNTGNHCNDENTAMLPTSVPRLQLKPPMLMQGPWMGVRLDYGIDNYDFMIPQAGNLTPINCPPEMWEYELAMKEDAWQGY